MTGPSRAQLWGLAALLLWAGCCGASSIGGAQDVMRVEDGPSRVATAGYQPRGPAIAQMVPPMHTNAAPGVTAVLARVCWKEADFRLPDCAAIVYVLEARARRSGWSLERMAWAYASLGQDNPRATKARALPDGDALGFSDSQNEQWLAVRRVVRGALLGRTANPCPGARHWGGPRLEPDARRAAAALSSGRWQRVHCKEPTANHFYREAPVIAAASAAGGYK